MSYTFSQLIDKIKLQNLLDSLNLITNISCTIVERNGEILACSGWTTLCNNFHNINNITKERCLKVMTHLTDKIRPDESYFIFQCPNGLMNIGSPIIVDGNHIATVFICQFLNWYPDIDFFTKQAQIFGFNEEKYIEAVKAIPVTSVQKIMPSIDFLVKLTELIGEMGLKHLNQKKSIRKISINL